jgi:hypothetical protein
VQGQEVAVVLDQEMQAGEHTVTWNTGYLPQGVYFYRLRTDDYFWKDREVLVLSVEG